MTVLQCYYAGGACGYEDVEKAGFGLSTTAVSTVLFNNGQTCGACYEIKCTNSSDCKRGKPSLFVTTTDHCPSGGWCAPPQEHFDLAKPSFTTLAEHKCGVIPIQYRRYAMIK